MLWKLLRLRGLETNHALSIDNNVQISIDNNVVFSQDTIDIDFH